MREFDLHDFIARTRSAARQENALGEVRRIMNESFQDPRAISAAMTQYQSEAEVLFEDETVSIWYCRFDPGLHVPPHDHQTAATIGVYEGAENNHFYRVTADGLDHAGTRCLKPGDVISLGPDAIHSVESVDGATSYGIHVYLAPLTTIERSLFDWETGEALAFTDAACDELKRVKC